MKVRSLLVGYLILLLPLFAWPSNGTAFIKANCMLFEEPSYKTRAIGTLKANQKVKVESGLVEGDWIKIKAKGREGYTRAENLSDSKIKFKTYRWRPVAALPPVSPAPLPSGSTMALNPVQGSGAFLLFGGQDHMTFLGCLNCSSAAANSVLNQFGTYGSSYSATSIRNHYSIYGSAYSTVGACNQFATDPPVIVTNEGKYLGRLTRNEYHPEIGIGRDYQQFLDGMCTE
jgi:hypothetical protein